MITLLKRSPLVTATLAFAVLTLIATAVLAGPPADRTSPAFRAYAVPVSRVISYQDGVGLLNTTTGALFELRGDLDNEGAQLNWFPRVEGIEGGSGYLQVQSPRFTRPDAVFLVDVVTGDTWILRDRGNHNGSWEPVKMSP